MKIDYRKNIKAKQLYNEKLMHFDPDSSPEAWAHYKKQYKTDANIFKAYSINEPSFFEYVLSGNFKEFRRGLKDENGALHNYVNCSKSKGNRLYALSHKDEVLSKGKTNFYKAQLRLGGETDFNFNAKHFPQLEAIIRQEPNAEKQNNALLLLEECKKAHHTLLNFSLMQAMGNLQGFKGRCCHERLDKFVFSLNEFYNTPKEDRAALAIATQAQSADNGLALTGFLNNFENVYDYCTAFYFINDKDFVNALIENGTKSIKSCDDVVYYMNLAKSFWAKKEAYFKKK